MNYKWYVCVRKHAFRRVVAINYSHHHDFASVHSSFLCGFSLFLFYFLLFLNAYRNSNWKTNDRSRAEMREDELTKQCFVFSFSSPNIVVYEHSFWISSTQPFVSTSGKQSKTKNRKIITQQIRVRICDIYVLSRLIFRPMSSISRIHEHSICHICWW